VFEGNLRVVDYLGVGTAAVQPEVGELGAGRPDDDE
jgi:hypothetical protein